MKIVEIVFEIPVSDFPAKNLRPTGRKHKCAEGAINPSEKIT